METPSGTLPVTSPGRLRPGIHRGREREADTGTHGAGTPRADPGAHGAGTPRADPGTHGAGTPRAEMQMSGLSWKELETTT